jgi:glycosyltransferase involved in cell wall biosynthesis
MTDAGLAPLEGGSARVTPQFSIITASFNQAVFLEETLRSVRDQGRSDVEHLVLDGGSGDGSVEVLRAHDDTIAYWRSAPDGGQSAAWNEGVQRSRGSIIAFLNSDDVLQPGALDEMARLADESPDAEWFIGGTRYFGDDSRDLVYPGRAPARASDVLYFGAYSPQPGQFFRRSLVERVGAFDESLHFSFDFDFFVRCALADARVASTVRIVAGFRFHGASKTVTQDSVQQRETRTVESRYWVEVERREGWRARRARDLYHGRFALGDVRRLVVEGRRREGWGQVGRLVREYPRVVFTRAFAGAVQRLLGWRR